MIILKIHTNAVRLISTIDRAKAFMYLVMAFPVMLNMQVVIIVPITQKNRNGDENI